MSIVLILCKKILIQPSNTTKHKCYADTNYTNTRFDIYRISG